MVELWFYTPAVGGSIPSAPTNVYAGQRDTAIRLGFTAEPPCAKSVPAGLAHPVDRHLSGSHRPSWGPYWTATTNAAPNVRRPGAGTAPKPAKPPTTASPQPDRTLLTANARGTDSNYERAERLKAPKPETFLCYRSCGR